MFFIPLGIYLGWFAWALLLALIAVLLWGVLSQPFIGKRR